MRAPKVFLLTDEGKIKVNLPSEDADHVVVGVPCPACGCANFRAQGHGKRPSKDDRAWEADASCLTCNAYVGTLRIEVNTLFGVREDEAVLRGRCRIY